MPISADVYSKKLGRGLDLLHCLGTVAFIIVVSTGEGGVGLGKQSPWRLGQCVVAE